MLRASLRSCLRMTDGPTLALPGPAPLNAAAVDSPVHASGLEKSAHLTRAPGVASLLPPHDGRPDAGASRAGSPQRCRNGLTNFFRSACGRGPMWEMTSPAAI